MAFMVQRVETAPNTDEIMARFCPIAPKPPSPLLSALVAGSSNGTHKHGRQEDYYHVLLLSHLPAPVWWPTCVGLAAWPVRKHGQQ
jgi:hypothetical protein